MRSQMSKRGFTLIELLVVIAIIAILASILFPVFAKAREQARKATCISQVRQIATAIQMYVQDNNSTYPGQDTSTWVSKVTAYLGNSGEMFKCPSDAQANYDNPVSYAFSGALVQLTGGGRGIKEAAVVSPSEVGALCDATPSENYPTGRLLGGGGGLAVNTALSTADPRHSKGVVVGYCDGHAKYFQGTVDEADISNGVTRAFFAAASLGLVDNPAAMLASGGTFSATTSAPAIGGEYATYPLLAAVGKMNGTGYLNVGFKGSGDTTARPSANYAWGAGSAFVTGAGVSAVAYDGVCVIVSKASKVAGVGSLSNGAYDPGTGWMATKFAAGYAASSVQCYVMSNNCDTTTYVKDALGITDFGNDTIQVANDVEMVEKVANDPYAIGYCSTVFADPDRVVILGVDGQLWPRTSTKFRWTRPAMADSSWPWKRALNVTGNGTGATFQTQLQTGAFHSVLNAGAMFKVGYWPGTTTW